MYWSSSKRNNCVPEYWKPPTYEFILSPTVAYHSIKEMPTAHAWNNDLYIARKIYQLILLKQYAHKRCACARAHRRIKHVYTCGNDSVYGVRLFSLAVFDCGANNPCSTIRRAWSISVFRYKEINKYVKCMGVAHCTVKTCPESEQYVQALGRCL